MKLHITSLALLALWNTNVSADTSSSTISDWSAIIEVISQNKENELTNEEFAVEFEDNPNKDVNEKVHNLIRKGDAKGDIPEDLNKNVHDIIRRDDEELNKYVHDLIRKGEFQRQAIQDALYKTKETLAETRDIKTMKLVHLHYLEKVLQDTAGNQMLIENALKKVIVPKVHDPIKIGEMKKVNGLTSELLNYFSLQRQTIQDALDKTREMIMEMSKAKEDDPAQMILVMHHFLDFDKNQLLIEKALKKLIGN